MATPRRYINEPGSLGPRVTPSIEGVYEEGPRGWPIDTMLPSAPQVPYSVPPPSPQPPPMVPPSMTLEQWQQALASNPTDPMANMGKLIALIVGHKDFREALDYDREQRKIQTEWVTEQKVAEREKQRMAKEAHALAQRQPELEQEKLLQAQIGRENLAMMTHGFRQEEQRAQVRAVGERITAKEKADAIVREEQYLRDLLNDSTKDTGTRAAAATKLRKMTGMEIIVPLEVQPNLIPPTPEEYRDMNEWLEGKREYNPKWDALNWDVAVYRRILNKPITMGDVLKVFQTGDWSSIEGRPHDPAVAKSIEFLETKDIRRSILDNTLDKAIEQLTSMRNKNEQYDWMKTTKPPELGGLSILEFSVYGLALRNAEAREKANELNSRLAALGLGLRLPAEVPASVIPLLPLGVGGAIADVAKTKGKEDLDKEIRTQRFQQARDERLARQRGQGKPQISASAEVTRMFIDDALKGTKRGALPKSVQEGLVAERRRILDGQIGPADESVAVAGAILRAKDKLAQWKKEPKSEEDKARERAEGAPGPERDKVYLRILVENELKNAGISDTEKWLKQLP